MKNFICYSLVIMSFIAMPVYAVQPDRQSDKSNYQKEIEKLKKENSKEYEEMKRASVLAAQLVLAELGYCVSPFDGILDEKTKIALRAYEKRKNIPETGDPLSFETMEQLKTDTEIIEHHPIYLPRLYVFTDFWDSGYVSAIGTWVLVNDKIGWPEQTSKIDCDRSLNSCTVAVAIVSGEGSNRILSLDIKTYEIERWDDHEIVTKPLQTIAGCVRYIIRINRPQKTVIGIRSTISDDGMCKGVDTKEMYLVLTDGLEVYRDLAQERGKKYRQLLNISPALLEYLESSEKEKSK